MKKHFIFSLIAVLSLSLLISCGTPSDNNQSTESESGKETSDWENSGVIQSESELEFELSADKASYIVTGKGTCPDSDLVIPDTYGKKPVTAIKEGAFAGNTDITSIKIPDGVITIGANAFSFMPSLKSVTISNSVTSIGEKAFFNSPALESITLGNGISVIEKSTFEGCLKLESIAIPDSVTTIKASAFYGCSALKSITLGSAISKVEFSVFDNTALYLDNANWSDGQLYIGSVLVKVKDDTSGILNVKDGTTIIADHAANMTDITKIVLPSSVKAIGSSSFAACAKLSDITFNEGLETLGASAFASCDSIVTVNLPSTLTAMSENVFYHCSALESVVIPSKITVIPDHAFDECASLSNITLPEGLKTIGTYGFSNCYSLISLKLPDSLEEIKNSAFYKGYNLLSINLPKNLKVIEPYAFLYCHKLVDLVNDSSLNIELGKDSNGNAGQYAFEFRTGESKLDYVGDFVFYTYNNINYLLEYVGNDKDVVLPDNYKGQKYRVYKFALGFTSKIETVRISEGVSSINGNAFHTCNELREITLTTNITSIANSTFASCTKLQTVKYTGTEEEFAAISIAEKNNATFINAEKIYNVA